MLKQKKLLDTVNQFLPQCRECSLPLRFDLRQPGCLCRDLIAMRLRRVPPLTIVNPLISATKAGLPIGLQLIGGPFQDLTTLRFAQLLEAEGLTA